jgi:hypothetical protein
VQGDAGRCRSVIVISVVDGPTPSSAADLVKRGRVTSSAFSCTNPLASRALGPGIIVLQRSALFSVQSGGTLLHVHTVLSADKFPCTYGICHIMHGC